MTQQKVLRGTMPSIPSYHANSPVSSAALQTAPSDPERYVEGVSCVDDTLDTEYALPQYSMLDNVCNMVETAHAALSSKGVNMSWDRVVVLIQPKTGDKVAKDFAVAYDGKVVRKKNNVSAKISMLVKHVGTWQSVRGDPHADVKNRTVMMNANYMPLQRSLAKVSKGFRCIMLNIGDTPCSSALLYNLHTHTRLGNVLIDRLTTKLCAVYRSCKGFRSVVDQYGVWSRRSNTEISSWAQQLDGL